MNDARIMRVQLEHLIVLQRRSNVSLRIVPLSSMPHPALDGPFSLYGLPDGSSHVFVEARYFAVALTEPADVEPFMKACQGWTTARWTSKSRPAWSGTSWEGSAMNERQWRKSSHSGSVHNCIEVALTSDAAAVRDSKNPHGGILAFDSHRWRNFLSAVKCRDEPLER